MEEYNKKKNEQLGMPHGTANNRLRKTILFSLLKKYGENICFQCGKEIETEEELSIEHKIPWLDSGDPASLFFDLDNIAYSHLSCNVGASRREYKVESGKKVGGHNKIIHPEGHRICSCCHESKTLDNYTFNRTKVSGYQDECKECKRKRMMKYKEG